MSMIGELRAVAEHDLAALRGDPSSLEEFLYGPDPEKLDHLDGLEASGSHLSLDKAWHGLHYLFTGTAWEGEPPLNFLVAGEELGEEDIGYEPPRAHSAPAVVSIARELSALTPEDLRARFDPPRMIELEIYPEIWDRDPAEDDTLGYLIEYFELLRSFVRRAADEGLGMIVWVD